MIPETHRAVVDRMLAHLVPDRRIAGVLAAGSWITADMDEHSDIDLIVVATEDAHVRYGATKLARGEPARLAHLVAVI